MFSVITLVFLRYLLLFTIAVSTPSAAACESEGAPWRELYPRDSSLDSWVNTENVIAVDRLLANIAPGGQNAGGATPGTVIASPSRAHPNYYYQCKILSPNEPVKYIAAKNILGIRDAAITTSSLVSIYASDPSSPLASQILDIMSAYTSLSYNIQHTTNPSGSFGDLSGLGEPKFNVDGTPFTGPWGRPQRDGLALRALTLMQYLNAHNNTHPSLWTPADGQGQYKNLYTASMPPNSVIKADLEYVSHNWQSPGFDLWEEVNGMHFFTAMVQLRALREGTIVATLFGDPAAAAFYQQQADALSSFIAGFWDNSKGHLIETMNSPRSGLDCGILLGALHGTGTDYTPNEGVYPPWSDEVLVTLLAFVTDQRARFPINSAAARSSDPLAGVGVGRYPEDVYDGDGTSTGNPWFLCTASVSEVLYRTAAHAEQRAAFAVTQRNLPFWQAVLPGTFSGARTVPSSDAAFHPAVQRLKDVGDGFLGVVRAHATAQGDLSEEFDGVTGFERGAANLTWSYGAFVDAVRGRGELPAVS